MKMYFVIYIFVALLFGFWGFCIAADKTKSRINFPAMIAVLMLTISPVFAKIFGIL